MSLLFAEHGIEVNFYDPMEENVTALLDQAKEVGREDNIIHRKEYEDLCKALDKPRVFVFSIPHGNVGDKTVEGLKPYLESGDVIMDASNEYWLNTERRQKKLQETGIHYIGMGVSGGYQSARHGPSISPGGDGEALDMMMPFLEKVAAKDKYDRPCTTKVGPNGSGHYVKMVHNGIEQGMMSTLCEVWMIMSQSLSMTYEDIASTWEQWNKSGPLHDNFLISIGVDICRTKDPLDTTKYLLTNIRDKVVQDVDETEGTGTWTCQEAVTLHVSAPTITSAHLFRLESADAARRIAVERSLPKDAHSKPKTLKLEPHMPLEPFLEDLKMSTYFSFLCAFIQGLHIISAASTRYDWNIDFADLIQLWRGGCIIQSDGIADLLEAAYRDDSHSKTDLLEHPNIMQQLIEAYPGIKNVVLKGTEADCYIPSISASLEYFKYSSSTELPTQFMEAELDYFGGHMFDLKSAGPGKPVTGERSRVLSWFDVLTVSIGQHHFEWKPAKGIFDDQK